MRATVIFLAIIITSPNLSSQIADAAELAGRAEVVDGDTIILDQTNIRLRAIDAPELRQPCKDAKNKIWKCGKSSTKALSNLIKNKLVKCKGERLDAYNRRLMFCSVDNLEINKWMVVNGWAFAFAKYDNRYQEEQEKAIQQKLGIFQGSVVAPWEWRNNRFRQEAENRKDGCIIKGNISSKREKIYHLPHQIHYGRTKIDEHRGEEWFCKEKDALASGWRRSLR